MIEFKTNITDSIEFIQDYFSDYDGQKWYHRYDSKTYLLDCIYGIGLSFDDKYKYHGGFMDFKRDLLMFLLKDLDLDKGLLEVNHLKTLVKFFDQKYPNDQNREVQEDVQKWINFLETK